MSDPQQGLLDKRVHPPLHLASVQENLPAIEALYQAGAKLDVQDAVGYTPLHHLAMKGHTQGVEKLLSWGANGSIKNQYGANYSDLLDYIARFRGETPRSIPKELRLESSCISPDVQVVDKYVASPHALLILWAAHFDEDAAKQLKQPSLLSTTSANYQLYLKNPPKLSIEPIRTNDRGEVVTGKLCGVIAEEPIKKGAVVAEYFGEILPDTSDEEYLLDEFPPVDSARFRSVAAMVNDGFPNVGWENVHSEKGGIPYRRVFVALSDIAKGEQIVVDYGPRHSIKTLGHVELRPQAIRDYLKIHPVSALLRVKYDRLGTPEQKIEQIDQLIKLYYLVSTPTVFSQLAEEGLINQKDIDAIRSQFIPYQPEQNLMIHFKSLRSAEKILKRRKEEL